MEEMEEEEAQAFHTLVKSTISPPGAAVIHYLTHLSSMQSYGNKQTINQEFRKHIGKLVIHEEV